MTHPPDKPQELKAQELADLIQVELNKRGDGDLLEICEIFLKMGYTRPPSSTGVSEKLEAKSDKFFQWWDSLKGMTEAEREEILKDICSRRPPSSSTGALEAKESLEILWKMARSNELYAFDMFWDDMQTWLAKFGTVQAGSAVNWPEKHKPSKFPYQDNFIHQQNIGWNAAIDACKQAHSAAVASAAKPNALLTKQNIENYKNAQD